MGGRVLNSYQDPSEGPLLATQRLSNLGGQGGEATPDLVRLGDLQRFANRQGLVPGPSRPQVAPNSPKGVAKVPDELPWV